NSVESVPHNAVHVDVGGEWTKAGKTLDGWMIDPDTAALDPIFWLHHANIDRLWTVWNRISKLNTDPAGSVNVGGKNISWSTSVKFSFNDATGKVVTMTPSQVIDSTKTPFAYDYDNTSNPLPAPPKVRRSKTMTPPPRPEMLGASSKKVTLKGSS